jgi:hypothetical protein
MKIENLWAKVLAYHLYANADVDFAAWQWLRAHSVELDFVTQLIGPIVRRCVHFFDDGTFKFDEFGENAFCFVVLDPDAATEIDIVAWSISYPERFGSYLDVIAVLCLNGGLKASNPWNGGLFPLWRTPLQWLQEKCEGAVVFDPKRAAPMLRAAPGPFLVGDTDFAAELVTQFGISARKIFMRRNGVG